MLSRLSIKPRILRSDSEHQQPDRNARSVDEGRFEASRIDPESDDEAEVSRIIQEAATLGIPADVRLVELAHRRLYRIAVGLVGHRRYSLTLGPTALVNEGYEKMFTSGQFEGIQSVAHFYARFTLCMKHAMIDYFRSKKTLKRGKCVLLSLAAMERGERYRRPRLHKAPVQDPAYSMVEIADILAVMAQGSAVARRAAQVFELQFFGALTVREMISATGVSRSTIESDLRYAKAYILDQLLPNELDDPV
jgi:DNA-directed RNA polymerase specialized sigma24 family protein